MSTVASTSSSIIIGKGEKLNHWLRVQKKRRDNGQKTPLTMIIQRIRPPPPCYFSGVNESAKCWVILGEVPYHLDYYISTISTILGRLKSIISLDYHHHSYHCDYVSLHVVINMYPQKKKLNTYLYSQAFPTEKWSPFRTHPTLFFNVMIPPLQKCIHKLWPPPPPKVTPEK